MHDYQMGVIETKFAKIIWDNEPISSTVLAKICEEQFNWKKSTTYTVLKRLSDKGIFINNKGIVSSLITEEDYYSSQSDQFIKEKFNGSLPAFLNAFTSKNALTKEEVEYLRKLVNDYKEV